MTKLNILYEGKAKILYETNVTNELIQFFKDDATAHNAQKLEIISSKGIITVSYTHLTLPTITGV